MIDFGFLFCFWLVFGWLVWAFSWFELDWLRYFGHFTVYSTSSSVINFNFLHLVFLLFMNLITFVTWYAEFWCFCRVTSDVSCPLDVDLRLIKKTLKILFWDSCAWFYHVIWILLEGISMRVCDFSNCMENIDTYLLLADVYAFLK